MNVFEDLVVELKEENLLENTVIEGFPINGNFAFREPSLGRESDLLRREAESSSKKEAAIEDEPRGKRSSKPNKTDVQASGASVEPSRLQKHFSEASSVFQMVGHVLTAVERQFIGSAQPPIDDLRVSKALHRLTQLSADALSVEFAEAEQAVENEIWAWQLALSQRDHIISVSQLRKYCESCQPALSSQALFSLARFYYEGPATDAAREKFDFVLTKLFTRPGPDGERQLICTKPDIVGHLRSRFINWTRSSEADVDDNLVNSLSCDDFIAEVEHAENLDELVASDLFGRVRAFKESMGDDFFSPSVAAAVIDCNVRIGNRFVQFLKTESKLLTAEQMKERYGHLDRDSFESTANRTFDLEEVLRSAEGKREARKRKSAPATSAIDSALVEHRIEPEVVKTAAKVPGRFSLSSLAVNKWLLIFGTIAVVASIGLYIWAERMAGDMPVSSDVKVVDLENSSFKEFVKDARISSETFYGVTTMAWEQLSKQEKEDLVAKIIKSGTDKGYKKVSLINGTGKTVGFGTANRVQVNEQ
jgi:hypothetical protein